MVYDLGMKSFTAGYYGAKRIGKSPGYFTNCWSVNIVTALGDLRPSNKTLIEETQRAEVINKELYPPESAENVAQGILLGMLCVPGTVLQASGWSTISHYMCLDVLCDRTINETKFSEIAIIQRTDIRDDRIVIGDLLSAYAIQGHGDSLHLNHLADLVEFYYEVKLDKDVKYFGNKGLIEITYSKANLSLLAEEDNSSKSDEVSSNKVLEKLLKEGTFLDGTEITKLMNMGRYTHEREIQKELLDFPEEYILAASGEPDFSRFKPIRDLVDSDEPDFGGFIPIRDIPKVIVQKSKE